MPNVTHGDFYEDDELAEEIADIFEAGEKGLTGPVRGWTHTLPAVRLPDRNPFIDRGANRPARAAG
jgi:hypothetical protein